MVQAIVYLFVAHFHRNRAEVFSADRVVQQLPMGADVLIKAFKYSAFQTVKPMALHTAIFREDECR